MYLGYIYKIQSISHKSLVCSMFWPRTQKHRSLGFNRRKSFPVDFGVNRFIHNTLDLPQVAKPAGTPCCSRKNCWSWHGSCFGACSVGPAGHPVSGSRPSCLGWTAGRPPAPELLLTSENQAPPGPIGKTPEPGRSGALPAS